MPNEPIQGGPYPLLSDAANVPNDIKKVVDWAAPKMNMTFNSAGERDAAVPSPVDGMVCTIGSGNSAEMQVYMDGAWRPITTKAAAGRREGGAVTLPSTTLVDVAVGPVAWTLGGVTASGNGLQVPVSGLYSIDGVLRWASVSDTSIMQVRLQVNGSSIFINQAPRNMRYITASSTAVLEAGDVVTLAAYNYGAAVDASPFGGEPHLTVALVART